MQTKVQKRKLFYTRESRQTQKIISNTFLSFASKTFVRDPFGLEVRTKRRRSTGEVKIALHELIN